MRARSASTLLPYTTLFRSIVLENIFRFFEEKNMPPAQAAIQGTKEIGLAVMATTLSLLAVFLPVGFMGGIVEIGRASCRGRGERWGGRVARRREYVRIDHV